MNYFNILHIKDEYGICPSVRSEHQTFIPPFNHDQFYDGGFKLTIHTRDFLPRFTDLIFDTGWSSSNYVIISNHFKELLERFKLGEHRFYPAEIHFTEADAAQYGQHNIHENYYIFHVQPVASDDYLDVVSFRNKERVYKETGIFVSENLKKLLEMAQLTGVGFKQQTIDYQPKTQDKNFVNLQNFVPEKKQLNDHAVRQQYDKWFVRRTRILSLDGLVNAYYEARGVPMPTDPLELKIRETETLLNVVLPDDYKTMLLSGTLPNGLKLQDFVYWTNRNIYEESWDGYPVYNPLGLTQIGLENGGGSPELIRAVVVAKDYSDTSLVFILRDDSDVELDPHLVMVGEHSVRRTKVTMTTAQQKTGFIYCHEWSDNHPDWNDDLSQSESTDQEKWLERCTRILNTQGLVNAYYASRGVPMPTDPLELKIRQSETLLNVVLPEDYKKMLLTGTLPIGFQNGNDIYWMGGDIHKEHSYQDYLPVKNPLGLYQIGTEWTEDAPELVRAIIIGDDGIGNSLIFMLRSDSDVELDSEIVILDHDPYLVARTGVTTTIARQKAILIAQVTYFGE